MKRLSLSYLFLSFLLSPTLSTCVEKTYFAIHGTLSSVTISDADSGVTTEYKRRYNGTFTRKTKQNGNLIEQTEGFTEKDLRNSEEINGNNEIDELFEDDELSE